MNITPTTARLSDGWVAVLEFPNGGRQRFTSRHGTMEAAQREANHALRCRLAYPDACVPDPQPHRLLILETLESQPLPDHGARVETAMAINHPNVI